MNLSERRSNVTRFVSPDTVIVLEEPRIAPYKQRIRESLAMMLRMQADRVNVKAKTAEGVGPVGEGLAVEARAVVLLQAGAMAPDG